MGTAIITAHVSIEFTPQLAAGSYAPSDKLAFAAAVDFFAGQLQRPGSKPDKATSS
jgi:hypothetical protein